MSEMMYRMNNPLGVACNYTFISIWICNPFRSITLEYKFTIAFDKKPTKKYTTFENSYKETRPSLPDLCLIVFNVKNRQNGCKSIWQKGVDTG
jgi:hypothetical protein